MLSNSCRRLGSTDKGKYDVRGNTTKKNWVLYDLSEFVKNPVRSGIQRVAFEIMFHWPLTTPLVPFKIDDAGQPRFLPDNLMDLMTCFFRTGAQDDLAAVQGIMKAGKQASAPLSPEKIFSASCVLNPELFFDIPRIKFYEWMTSHRRIPIFFIIFDFLPWLYPDAFPVGAIGGTMHYLRLLRSIDHLAFISDATKRDFIQRIVRKDRVAGPVLKSGSDGLGTNAPAFSVDKKTFTVLGTLEPRKNHINVVQSFLELWLNGVQVELTFVGRLGWLENEHQERIERLEREEPRFRWLKTLKDSQVREVVCGSRATIYPSTVEGFGLPPLESLALGVPVIVTEALPSIEMLPPNGQIRLPSPDVPSISQAVVSLLDDDLARRKCEEIKSLRLPMWSDLAKDVAEWIDAAVSQGQ